MNAEDASDKAAAVPPAPAALIRRRAAHHEAGHAVAVVARGGTLIRVRIILGSGGDWLPPEHANTSDGTEHRTAWKDQPFVVFAGPWAEAKWLFEHQIYGHADLAQALV